MPRLIERIDQAVNEAKMDDAWRRAYMTYQVHQRDAELRGIAIGEKRGEVRGEKRGIAIGEKRGIAIGEKRGEKRGIMETAKKMLQADMTVGDVARITGLTLDEVKALADQPLN